MLAVVALLALGGRVAAAESVEVVGQVREDTARMASWTSRVPGSSGHEQALGWLREQLRSLPTERVRIWEHSFQTMMPFTDAGPDGQDASLVIHDGPRAGSHRVYPLWPSGVRLNTTPAEGFTGELVYIGRGDIGEVPPRSLRGQIAVMELSGGWNWQRAFLAGASALVLLGSEDVLTQHGDGHLWQIPISCPRFYIPDGPVAAALRQGGRARATLRCGGEWRSATATNLYVLVRPAADVPPQPALMIAVRSDGMSIVPDLSPDADSAVDVAVALHMLREWAARPPRRPVVVAFIDAFGINQLGMRQMLGAMGLTPDQTRVHIAEDRRLVEEEYVPAAALLEQLPQDPAQGLTLADPRHGDLRTYLRDEVSRDVATIEATLQPLRLHLHSVQGDQRAAVQERVALLDQQRRARLTAYSLLTESNADALRRAMAQPATLKLLRDLWNRTRHRIRGQLAEARARLDQWDQRDQLRRELAAELGLDPASAKPVAFVLGIDLSDAGVVAGPQLYCSFLQHLETGNIADFRRWMRNLDEETQQAIWPGALRGAVDLQTLAGIDAPASSSVSRQATLTSPTWSFGIQGVTWATLDARPLRLDTPLDTADRLDWSRLGPQVEATARLVHGMIDDPRFKATAQPTPRWNRGRGVIVDRASGEPLPRVPMAGYLVTLVNRADENQLKPAELGNCAGVRRSEFGLTGTDGRFEFNLWPTHVGGGWGYDDRRFHRFVVQAYALDDRGRIVRAVDMGRAGKLIKLDVDFRSTERTPLRGVAFTCAEQTQLGMVDPRFLLPLSGTILDAGDASPPQRLNVTFMRGGMSALLEPGTRWELVLRAGITRNRMALLNLMEPAEARASGLSVREAMRGFALGETIAGDPALVSATDMKRLDRWRLDDYEQAGIQSRAIEELQSQTRRWLDEAGEALRTDDDRRFTVAAGAALATEVRAYQAVRDTGNDVIRGAIFLLLALVPFSFAMERLVLACATVYRQIGGAMGIFAGMTAMLWSFHPAFRISSQPLMIVMAFAVICMSLLVLGVIYSRFVTGLEELRSGRAESSGASTSRTGVLVTAVRLGIANMRKRKLRTALTGLSVVLITFALLCFMSTSRYSGKREYEVGAAGEARGLLLREPSSRALPTAALELLRAQVGPAHPLAERWWLCDPGNAQWRVHVRHAATGQRVSLPAAVGFSPAERAMGWMEQEGGSLLPRWDRFASGGGCYLAAETADRLGARVGDALMVAGETLELLGTFDGGAMDKAALDMDGRSLMPTDYALMPDAQRNVINTRNVGKMDEEMSSGGSLDVGADLPSLRSAEVVIVPSRLIQGLRQASLRSIALPMADGAAAREAAQALSQRVSYPVYYAQDQAVRVIATTPLMPQAPRGLLIPLAIGGLIIFNTMLSSIAERRREIHVYTSLGLAPLHVAVLFLSEAVTYGLMGAIFGYVAGQGVATALSGLGLMGGITLNYSGTQAVTVMLLVLGVVVLSSLVPAYLGGRMAAPSNRTTWAIEAPEGDHLRHRLPFTATPQAAPGVMSFLLEYLDAHREGSIGHFASDRIEVGLSRVNGHEMPLLRSTVWLAPYDLGIRQDVVIELHPSGDPGVLEFNVRIQRQAGQPGSWWKLNRVFLGELRKQMLGWRKLKTQRVLEHIDNGRKLALNHRAHGAEPGA